MAKTQIDGSSQIQNETIGNAQIATNAAIALSKLAEAVIQADGGQAFTANQSMGGNKLTTLGTPTNGTDAVNKEYVDSMVTAGVSWKPAVDLATVAPLPANTPTLNVLTADDVGILAVDGINTVLGDRILVQNEVSGEYNGIYDVTTAGTASVAFVLTRSADANLSSEVISGMAVFVQRGSTVFDMGFVLTTNDPITLNTTPLVFTQFTSVGQIIAGAGLTKSVPNTLDVGAGDGISVGADAITIALNATSGLVKAGGLKVGTGDGIQVDAASITVKLDGVSIAKSGSGIKVDYSRWVTRETPAGDKPGNVFTTAVAVLSGTENVFLNGILQEAEGEDYTFSSTNTITFVDTVKANDRVKVNYIKA